MDWIPALTTTSLLALLLWLARNFLITFITRGVEHKFNQKLEKIRSDYRQQEEKLRADLQARAAEIEALRVRALSAMSGRQASIDKRRLEAVDQLWASVTTLGPARLLAASLAPIKIDTFREMAKRDERLRQVVEMLGLGFDEKKLDHTSAAKAQPFVSPMVWAVYSAMRAVTSHAVITWHGLKEGHSAASFIDEEKIKSLIKAALPHYSGYIDENGSRAFYFTLDALESQLIEEIQRMMEGKDNDKATIDRANEIRKYANEVLSDAATSGIAK